MALPVAKAKSLASDMAKKGLIGSISMSDPKEGEEMEGDDAPMDDMQPVMDDIDAMVPGLGKLVLELCEKCMAKSGDDGSSE